ncbi:hypothetical protein CMT22_17840 [Elizabethkingia anophelis]|nr:hypothetical protein [Elizabethkingia anophelis]
MEKEHIESFAIVKNSKITLRSGMTLPEAKKSLLETVINELDGYCYDKENQIIYNTKTNKIIGNKENEIIVTEDEKVIFQIFEEL